MRFRLRTLLVVVGLSALALGAERARRRWDYYRAKERGHAAREEFCRESAATFRRPEFWDPIAAEPAAREAERQARLRRSSAERW